MLTPLDLLRPQRRIEGVSAVLLPFTSDGDVDWAGFEAHLERTTVAGLVPAVNMDTGSVHVIDAAIRAEVLRRTAGARAGQPWMAGAFVADEPGAAFDAGAHRAALEEVAAGGATPVVFPSHGLAQADPVEAHGAIAEAGTDFIAFELSPDFAASGRVLDLERFAALLDVDRCIGVKHSSLDRHQEWDRLRLRDERRPGFRIYTGNDRAIDMVMYGSDYLLGLSTFAPDLFARRDAMWEAGDPAFFTLNDGLQFLGAFAFRPPVPAYRHSATQFLHLRGWLDHDGPPPGTPARPGSDVDILRTIAEQLGLLER